MTEIDLTNLEPMPAGVAESNDPMLIAAVSAAISLKRIADHMATSSDMRPVRPALSVVTRRHEIAKPEAVSAPAASSSALPDGFHPHAAEPSDDPTKTPPPPELNGSDLVEVIYRTGTKTKRRETNPAGSFIWGWAKEGRDNRFDIVAYRIVRRADGPGGGG